MTAGYNELHSAQNGRLKRDIPGLQLSQRAWTQVADEAQSAARFSVLVSPGSFRRTRRDP